MKIILFVISLLTAGQILNSNASAASTPWIGSLAGGGSLTVPAGKILIIEQLSYSSSGPFQFTITGSAAGDVGSGTFSAIMTISVSGLTKLPSPIRLGPGMTITNNITGVPVAVFGTAMDLTDFIAFVSPVMKDMIADNGQLAALVDSRTSNLTKTIGETSTDLQSWTSVGVSIAQSSSNPRLSKVITPIDAPKKFVRAKLTMESVAAN